MLLLLSSSSYSVFLANSEFWTLATLLRNPKMQWSLFFVIMYITTSSAYSETFLVLWGFLSVFLWANMVLCGLMSDLSGVWSTGTCHPRQCSSSDCRGTQLIRHGNDGSMLLTSASFSGGVFPSGFCFSPSARDPFYLFWTWIIWSFYS